MDDTRDIRTIYFLGYLEYFLSIYPITSMEKTLLALPDDRSFSGASGIYEFPVSYFVVTI